MNKKLRQFHVTYPVGKFGTLGATFKSVNIYELNRGPMIRMVIKMVRTAGL